MTPCKGRTAVGKSVMPGDYCRSHAAIEDRAALEKLSHRSSSSQRSCEKVAVRYSWHKAMTEPEVRALLCTCGQDGRYDCEELRIHGMALKCTIDYI